MNSGSHFKPTTSRRASDCSLTVRGSEQAGFGWVCLNPETVRRLGLKPGDSVWLGEGGMPAPFSIESRDVKYGEAWLNPREMAAMGVRDGERLTASSVYHGPPLPEEHQVSDLIGVMAVMPDGRQA